MNKIAQSLLMKLCLSSTKSGDENYIYDLGGTADELAGQYAFTAAKKAGDLSKNGEDTSGDAMSFHLETLTEAGAIFDFGAAFQEAENWAADYQKSE